MAKDDDTTSTLGAQSFVKQLNIKLSFAEELSVSGCH